MKTGLSLLLLSGALLTGCSNPMESAAPRIAQQTEQTSSQSSTAPLRQHESPALSKEERFQSVMGAVAKSTKLDPKYHKISLNTPQEKVWFKNLMYRLWDRQITRDEFIRQGVAKYPDHHYEFTFIADAYQNY